MPSTPFEHPSDASKKGKIIKSAYDSETFDCDATIHVDGLVGSATISPCGRDIALGSPEGLAIIDLDSPFSPPRRLSSHGLPWLVVDVQWSPFPARDYWVASTANHRCLVWNLNLREDSANGAIEHSLQGHSRAITDINFSAHHPDILATCAVDGFVHSWDLRKPKVPVLSFCDWDAGATQVKFNRQNPNIVASSHDRWLRIWDDRNPSAPLKSITAHTSKIYGLDWDRADSTKVATCSLDKSIKFWDYATSEEHEEPKRMIKTDFPVWRARHTPFGWGVLAMPQNDPGNLYMYDIRRSQEESVNNTVDPVAVFPGHGSHKVKEFLWRPRGNVNDGLDFRDFQLVSWGEDNELRLHKMDTHALESVGHVKGNQARNISITRRGATYKSFRPVDDHSGRERRVATMSDSRSGSGGSQFRRSAMTLGLPNISSNHMRSGKGSAWKGQPMKARPHASTGVDRHHDQLGWMKGITMNKRKTPFIAPPRRKDSRDSTLFGSNYHNDHWGEPETLQDEIIRVNHQLPNVQWDKLDMDTLTLRAFLNGPWGTDGNTIFISVTVDIPAQYPKARAPRFLIEKTALMSENTYKKLDQEVNQLASQFSKKRQNCLDVAFGYLLGEIDLSSSDTFFKNVKDLDDDFAGIEDESSSEEEDTEIAAGATALSQELTASTELDASLAPLNRTAVPPLPRSCGARFSNDGRLVCFFPTKEERARALFTPSEGYRDRPKGEPTFAGFGRLQQESTPPRHRNLNDEMSVTEDQTDSDGSDDSSSSSDSETTYLHTVSMWHYLPGRRFRKALSGTYSMHSSGAGTGIGTGTGTAASRRRIGRAKNFVSIHRLAADLPSKRELAQEYRIFGDGAEICEHNARVAQKYALHDLVDVWRYAALLLKKGIPLELLEYEKQRQSVLVIAKNVVARFGSDEFFPPQEAFTGRVKWGHHPIAKDLIKGLLDYFEKIADVQMLAMLSCIFSESAAEDSIAYAELQLPQPETPLPMKAPAFSLDYFPPDISLWHASNSNFKSGINSAVSTPKTLHTPIHIVGSYDSEEAVWPGEPESTSYSCGETPPTRVHHKDHLSGGDPTQSLSTSPDNRLLRRANTALTTSLATFQRPFATIASTSPPIRKRISPGENILNNLTPTNITWGNSTVMGTISEPQTARNSISDDDTRREDCLPLVCYGISTELTDQTKFDDDGWLDIPFLEPSRTAIYACYRYAYAELLQMWELPFMRLEIMKFNVLKDKPPSSHFLSGDGEDMEGLYHARHSIDNVSNSSQTHVNINSPIAMGKKEQLQALVSSGYGIDIRGMCRVHETPLDPIRSVQSHAMVGGGVGTCERCKRAQTQMMCVYCKEPIDSLYPPCLSCGCTIHDTCLSEWHAADETECPAGDECVCVEDAWTGLVETRAVLMGAIRRGKVRKPSEDFEKEKKPIQISEKRGSLDKNDWETVVGSNLPSTDGQGKPLHEGHDHSQQPLSAARISLSHRLRKSAGAWGSSPGLRKKAAGGGGSSGLARF
ncbi:hypothetical protein F5Y16DRAFT_364573 [Xylariaceae sp. FL0255]|nr:hypothetical protein F5Y16DRAFT_364573 [Xylariaceae sp. FL0255]